MGVPLLLLPCLLYCCRACRTADVPVVLPVVMKPLELPRRRVSGGRDVFCHGEIWRRGCHAVGVVLCVISDLHDL